MASNIAVKISFLIVPSIASARDRPARGAFVASRLVKRNALAEFLGQALSSQRLEAVQPCHCHWRGHQRRIAIHPEAFVCRSYHFCTKPKSLTSNPFARAEYTCK